MENKNDSKMCENAYDMMIIGTRGTGTSIAAIQFAQCVHEEINKKSKD
jgi:hypothetical protein